MKIGNLGSGTMGSALSARFAQASHEVHLGSRRPGANLPVPGVHHCSDDDAAEHGELVFVALPWPHGLEVAGRLERIADKIIVDVSNPEALVGYELLIGHTTSGAEELARVTKGARVVKAFSHFYAELLYLATPFDGTKPSILYCGDDRDAKALVRRLIESCNLDPVDAGGLACARYLEPLAMLTVHLDRVQAWGPTGIAWKLMRDQDSAIDPG
jgi:8-hydroxy-5-deazaflavin:NADPH oxidoreductase